ncbi:hypothetical protein ACNKHX_01150 [Shigella flexneri]
MIDPRRAKRASRRRRRRHPPRRQAQRRPAATLRDHRGIPAESRGMEDLIKRLQPDCLGESIALVALFRPGRCSGTVHRSSTVSMVAEPSPIRTCSGSTEPRPVLEPTSASSSIRNR